MFQNASRFREAATGAEKSAWYLLRNRQFGGSKFRRQCPIGKYIVDFCFCNTALAIELDGSIHSQPSQARKDSAKDLFLKKRGIYVLRVPNGLVLSHPEEFLKKVREALTPRLAVPPLPAGVGFESF
jgi:very-short-patch-repair endonuclease